MNKKVLLFFFIITISSNISSSFRPCKKMKRLRSRNANLKEQQTLESFLNTLTDKTEQITEITEKQKIQHKWNIASNLYTEGQQEKNSTKIKKAVQKLNKHIAYQTLILDLRYQACLYLANYYKLQSTKENITNRKRFYFEREARKHLWTILRFARKRDTNRSTRAMAHMLVSDIYRKKATQNQEKRAKYLYVGYFYNRKARIAFKKLIQTEQDQIQRIKMHENLFACNLEIAIYVINCIYKIQNHIPENQQEKISRRVDRAIRCLNEIITYDNSANSNLISQYKAEALVRLATIHRSHFLKNDIKALELYANAGQFIFEKKECINLAETTITAEHLLDIIKKNIVSIMLKKITTFENQSSHTQDNDQKNPICLCSRDD